MSITPGAPLPETPSDDETSRVALPKTTESSSSSLYWASKDGLFVADDDGRQAKNFNGLYLPPEGMMSLFEFVKVINRSISEHEQTQEAIDLMDQLMNKRLHQNLAQQALLLRRYRSKLQSYLTRWMDIEDEIESMLGRLNRSIGEYLKDSGLDEKELEEFNQAVKRYNDPGSEAYGDQDLLEEAASKYDLYRGNAKSGTGRDGQVRLLNEALGEYNQKIQEINEVIETLNGERGSLDLDSLPLLSSISLVRNLPNVPEQPFADPGKLTALEYLFPDYLKEVELRVKPDPKEFMDANYDPVHNASIGYFNNLSNLLELSNEYEVYDRLMKRSFSTIFLDMLMVKFAKITFDVFGEGVTNDHSLAQAVSWATLERMLGNSSIRASMLEARIPLTPMEVDQVQLLILNLMTKTSMQAATGPAFQLLGNDLGHVGVGDEQMSVALAYGFMNRVRSLVGSGTIKANISALIENNPRLSSFPESDRKLLTRRLTSIVSLALLQNSVVHASIALGVPGVVAQVLGGSLQGIGVSGVLGDVNFNDAMRNRAVSVLVQSAIGKELYSLGFGNEEIRSIVSNAMEKALAGVPYRSAAELGDNLAMQLYSEGVPSLSLARALAHGSVALMLGASPRAKFDDNILKAGFTLGLIDPSLLVSDRAVGIILNGLDKEVFGPIFRRAVGTVFNTNTPGGLINDLNQDPYRLDIDSERSPTTLHGVLVQLYRGLVRQGTSIEDSLGISESTLKYLIRSKGAQQAFGLPPSNLKLALQGFHGGLEGVGLSEKDSHQLSGQLVLAGLSSPGELGDIGLVSKTSQALGSHIGSLKSLLGGASIPALSQHIPGLGGQLGDVAQGVVDGVFGDGAAFNGAANLGASVRRALSSFASSNQIAQDILSSPAASVLLDPSVNETLLRDRLIDQGISGGLAADYAKILTPYVHQMNIEGGGVKGHLESAITSQLLTSSGYAREVLESVNIGDVFNGQAISSSLAEALFSNEHTNDLTEAMAVASVVTKNVASVQGSVTDMVHYQNAILTNLATGWGMDKNAGSDLVASLNIEDAVNREALIGGLTQGLVNVGAEAGKVDQLARDISSASFSSTESRNEEDAVRGAVRHALLSTLGVDAEQAGRVASQMNTDGIVDVGNLKDQVANLLAGSGVDSIDDAKKAADEIVKRQMSIPDSLNSADDFRKAFQDAAYVTGVSPQTAVSMSEALRIDHIMHPEMLQLAAIRELHNAGFSEDESKKLASQASENLFKIGSSQINLHMTAERLKEEAVSREFAVNQLVDSIMGTDVVGALINLGDLQLSPLRNEIVIAVDRAIRHRQSAFNEEVFRNILRDEIALATNLLDSKQAEQIAHEVVITDTLRKELFIQELIHRAEEYLELGEGAREELRLVADEVFRDINAFTDKDAFDRVLLAALRKREFVNNIASDQIVQAMNAAIVLENVGSLFSPNSAQLMPQLELREQLTNIILENFQGAIPPAKAKQISEEFIMLLLGPLTTAYGRPNEESIMDLIKVQLDELIKQVGSKNYRKLILQGVTDTMSSSTQVNFDTFLFTEILNVNGMRFLKIIQDALLNNIGVEDRELNKTIDLLI
jgi:hypothetical protein